MARCQERIGPDFTAAEQTSETVYTLLKSEMIGPNLPFACATNAVARLPQTGHLWHRAA